MHEPIKPLACSLFNEVQLIQKLKALIDKKTGKVSVKHPRCVRLVILCPLKISLCLYICLFHDRFIKQDQVAIASLQATGIICLETFKEFPQMARFTLRDEGIHVHSVCVSVCVIAFLNAKKIIGLKSNFRGLYFFFLLGEHYIPYVAGLH